MGGILWWSSGYHLGSIPGWGIKIPQATQHGQKKKKKRLLTVKLVGSRWILGQLPMLNHKTEGSDDIEVDVEEMAWLWSGSRW